MRKRPTQQRSRALVDSLVEATIRTIAEEGLEAATTVRIAERAGVSVGSLYQYFDRKEDLYQAAMESLVAELQAVVDAELALLTEASISNFARHLLEHVWQLLEADDGRYLKVVRYWAQLDGLQLIAALEQKSLSALSLYLLHNPPQNPQKDLPVKAYIFVNSVMLTLVRYISDPPPNISREQLIDGFVALSEQLLV